MPALRNTLLYFVLLGCGLVSTYAATPKIGVLLKGKTNFWSSVEKGAKEAAESLGVEVIVKYPLSESDISTQIQLLNALAAQDVGCILLAPANAESLAKPVEALVARGIKVILLDSPLNSEAISSFIGIDHKAAGTAAGELLASLVGPTDEICLFRHAQGNLVTGAREDSALAALRSAHPGLIVFGDVYAGNAKEIQKERASYLLGKHPAATAVLASSTPATMAMLQVLTNQPKPGTIKLVGFGYNLNPEVAAAIDQGMMHGWIAQLPKQLGRIGLEQAVALLNGQPVAKLIQSHFLVISKANLHTPEVQALLSLD
jgi:ribose transport system substrate-binding protein